MTNPIKPTLKTEILPLAILALAIIASIFFYQNFPQQVPVHWNFAGEVDRTASKMESALGLPALLIILYLMFLFLPLTDPKKERYKQFRRVYHAFKAIILSLLFVIYMAVGLNGLGYQVPIGVVVPVAIGALFIVIGNYMGKIRSNWFVGIKNPWTLSSEEVWNKTHRLSGKLFILGGLLLMIEPILPVSWRLPVFIATLLLVLFPPFIYSYWLYRKQENKN